MTKILYILPVLAVLGMFSVADAASDQTLAKRTDRLEEKISDIGDSLDALYDLLCGHCNDSCDYKRVHDTVSRAAFGAPECLCRPQDPRPVVSHLGVTLRDAFIRLSAPLHTSPCLACLPVPRCPGRI